jgi:hypothetical protein
MASARQMPTFESHGKPIDLFLYHDKCSDGLGAAAAAWKKLGFQAEYVGCRHGDPPPEVNGKVLLVNFPSFFFIFVMYFVNLLKCSSIARSGGRLLLLKRNYAIAKK